MPSTRKPLSASMDIIVSTHSYRMELPVFFVLSWLTSSPQNLSKSSRLKTFAWQHFAWRSMTNVGFKDGSRVDQSPFPLDMRP